MQTKFAKMVSFFLPKTAYQLRSFVKNFLNEKDLTHYCLRNKTL